MNKNDNKKPKSKFLKAIFTLVLILVILAVIWIVFSLVGRVSAGAAIPDSAVFRLSISNPVRLLDGIMSHESMQEISFVPALSALLPAYTFLEESDLLKNRLLRFAARGNIEIALLAAEDGGEGKTGNLAAVWDMGLCSPILRVLPAVSGFLNIPNLYYVQSGKNSRFEYRLPGMTLFIGPYRNLLFISDSASVFESRRAADKDVKRKNEYSNIKPSAYDAALLSSPEFLNGLLSNQDASIAAIIRNIEFESVVEAGLSVYPKKLELRLTTPLSSRQPALSSLLQQRSQVPDITERLPSSSQYATILSAGTLEELYQAALVFSGSDLEDTIRRVDNSSRAILGLTINDLLFSWSGKEFAAFGMEGRPHPVYAIKISDERKRQDVFDRAFKSIVLNENVRLNLDGVRIPRIEVPEFLQSLLKKWNIFLPSPYYTIYKDYMYASESAETLLAALRAMQKNDVLPKTAAWQAIAGKSGFISGGSNINSAFSLYYSLDRAPPFFLRKNTVLSGFMGVYRHGLVRMGFNKGIVDISLALVPGSGSGVTFAGAVPVDFRVRPSNRVYGASSSRAGETRIFVTAGDNAYSVNLADSSINEFSGQGPLWILPAGEVEKGGIYAWIVNERGRVTLVDKNMEPANGYPVLTGLRLSSPPAAHEGRLYLCDEDGKVHVINTNGEQSVWAAAFDAALRSPPSLLTIASRNNSRTYAAVYPKSFFGEIWLLDADGKALPDWPAPITGIGFGSPALFTSDSNVYTAFVSQAGELSIFDEKAVLIDPFPVTLDGVFFQQPVFDGEFLWLVSSDGTLFRVSIYGEALSQKIPNFSVKEEGFITIFDCDGDKVPEVFITGEGNALFAFTRHFRSLEGFPLPAWGKPYFVEAQGGSKKAEILGMGMDRRLYRWQFK